MLTELGSERRELAVLGVSRMREEVGEGHDDVAEGQNTCNAELQKWHKIDFQVVVSTHLIFLIICLDRY